MFTQSKQIAQGPRMTAHGRMNGGGALTPITRLNLGKAVDEKLHNLLMTELTRIHERCYFAPRIWQRILEVAAVLDKHLDAVVVVARYGKVNGQLSTSIRLVEPAQTVLVVHENFGCICRVILLFETRMTQQHLNVDAATCQTCIVEWRVAHRVQFVR